MVGNVPIGSEHPIALQTMTTTDTRDVKATVEEVGVQGNVYIDAHNVTHPSSY